MLWLSTPALAHKPSFGPYASLQDPFVVEDPNISIVVYQEITCEEDQIWLNLSAEEGFPIYIQGGVPEIDRLADYKPHIALLAPGLPAPEQTLPFDIPAGMGVQVFSPEEEPSDFYEPFTQTSSWIWIEETVPMPQTGEGYLVAWNDLGGTGKLWVATGTVEDFSDVAVDDFILWNEYVNNFHETGRFSPIIPKEEESCLSESTEEQATSSCAQGKSALLLFPFMIFFRKRSRSYT